MVNGYVNHPSDIIRMLKYCEEADVDQLSFRPVTVPANCQDKAVETWTKEHQLSFHQERAIIEFIQHRGTRILRLPFGTVYDVDGQNVCITDCMTFDEAPGEMRQLICMPDGSVRYSWQHEGAILLR